MYPACDWSVDCQRKQTTSIRGLTLSDEGLTLETSAFQSLYGGQFTLSTLLINQIFVNIKCVDPMLLAFIIFVLRA